MSRAGPAGGWCWWAPSRRRRAATAEEEARAKARALLGAAALLAGSGLLLGLGGLALGLGLGLALAAAGAVWAAPRRGPQQPPQNRSRRVAPALDPLRPLKTSAAEGAANGGPRRCLARNPPPPHFVLPLRRRYPIHQAQYGSLGTLPSICWDGYQRKNRLSTFHSSPVQSPVTVKIARPDSHIGHSPLLEHLSSPGSLSFTPNNALDHCTREAVLSALKESRKRAMIEEEEEEEIMSGGQDNKRRRRESGQSLLEPLVANGMPASMGSKPGSLKRGLLFHGLDDVSSKRSRTSSLSSMSSMCAGGIPSSVRNAIASSYSSSRGFSRLWKRVGQSTSPLSSPASSRSQTPERPSKKARSMESSLTEEKTPQTNNTSTPVKADEEVQEVEATETPITRRSSPRSSSSLDAGRKRKRRVQLLTTRHSNSLFTLPPPPQLGYSVSSEDLDADKLVTLQRFNKVLEDKVADSTPEPPAETGAVPTTLSFSLLSAKLPSVPPPITAAAVANPLLESLKKKQGEQSSLPQAAVATEALQPLTPTTSLNQSSVAPSTTLEAKPLTLSSSVSLGMASPSPAATSAGVGPISGMATTASSEPVKPPSDTGVLGMLLSPPLTQPAASATSTAPNTTPNLKPFFGGLTKSDGLAFSSSNTPVSAVSSPTPPGVVPAIGQASGVPASTFKPIFGVPPTPTTTDPALSTATTAAASLFTFKQSPQLVPAHPTPTSQPTSGTSSFSGLLGVVGATPPASSSAMGSTTSATVSKPVFSFGLGTLTAPTSNSTAAAAAATTTVSAAQPFLFGSLPSATVSGTATAAPLFQFGKTAAASATEPTLNPAAILPFGKGPPGSTTGPAAAAATTTTTPAAASFSVFGTAAVAPVVPPTTTQQPAPLTFGSGTPAFSATFGTPSKLPPPYPSGASQLTVDASTPESHQSASKPGVGGPPSFGANFSFAGSAAQPATQPAFGSTTQAPFGGSGPLTSFGTKSSSQPAFGATTSMFSFGTATTSAAAPGFGANTQTTSSSGATGSIFGASASSSFTFGASSQPAAASSAFGLGAAVGGGSAGAPNTGFSFGSRQSGAAPPFGSSLPQQPPLSSQNQGSPFGFSLPGTTPESKPAFGGSPTPTFGQGLPTPGGGPAGSNLAFGTPINPAFGGAGTAFGPMVPTFSIGAGTKMGSRQRLQARRQARKK